jgi:hypothetical protein
VRNGSLACLVIAALGLSACAPRHIVLPSGSGTPRPDSAPIFEEATAACHAIQTITAELSLSGRAGTQRLRGRVQAGLSAPSAVRLEAPAPFGAPLFILAAPNERGTLLLPRDRRVIRDAPVRDVLGALAGVSLGSADLRAVVSGCVVPDPRPQGGRDYPRGWLAVDLQDGAVAWLRQLHGRWRVTVAEYGGLVVEYFDYDTVAQGMPRRLRVRSASAAGAADVDLSISLAQIELNVPLGPEVFEAMIPPGVVSITLDELRSSGPLTRP